MSDPLPSGAIDHGNGTLTISNVTERDGDLQFCCDVSNDRGQLCNCISINVLSKLNSAICWGSSTTTYIFVSFSFNLRMFDISN